MQAGENITHKVKGQRKEMKKGEGREGKKKGIKNKIKNQFWNKLQAYLGKGENSSFNSEFILKREALIVTTAFCNAINRPQTFSSILEGCYNVLSANF